MRKIMNRFVPGVPGIVIMSILCLTVALADPGDPAISGADSKTLMGTVYDAESKEPLLYATVSIINRSDSALISGVATDEQGRFSLETNQVDFLVRVDYVAYNPMYISAK